MDETTETTRPGSGAYYAIRFAPKGCRDDLLAVYGVIRSVDVIPRECAEAAVAHKKLDWWREELERSLRDAPRHPASQRLAAVHQRRPLPPEAFDTLLRGVEQEIVNRGFPSRQAFDAYCADTGGSIARLFTAAGGGDRRQGEIAGQLGRFSRQVRIIRNLGGDLRRGRLLLPPERFEARGVDAARLLQTGASPAFRAVLGDLSDAFRAGYRAAVADIPPGRHPALGTVYSFSGIAQALLQEMKKGGFDVLRARTSLTPVRKLWIAWRHHNRIREIR